MKPLINDQLADAPASLSAQLIIARESLADLETRVKLLDADLADLQSKIETGREVSAAVAERRKEWTALRAKTLRKMHVMSGFITRLEGMQG